MNTSTLHQHQPVLQTGQPLKKAKGAMIMVHGRGATAQSILDMSSEFEMDSLAYLAPQAYGNTWYPYSFLAPRNMNEPGISDGLQSIQHMVQSLNEQGIPNERIFLFGFSQGACLALEYAATHASTYAGVFALSGGLIGPEIQLDRYQGSFNNTPIFLGCSDVDPHIPKERVLESEQMLKQQQADVTVRLYAGMGHYINEDELTYIREALDVFAKQGS